MNLLRLNPQTLKKLRRFREIKRGYYSFLILSAFLLLSLFGEVLINNRALVVSYEGTCIFPPMARSIRAPISGWTISTKPITANCSRCSKRPMTATGC
jgi:ABC-type microcin C transport system permease subunit YejE